MAGGSRTKTARSKRSSRKRRRSRALSRAAIALVVLTVIAVPAALYGLRLAASVTGQFDGRRWDVPAQVYAAPLELYAGRALAADDLVAELRRLGYTEDPRLPGPGTYRVALERVDIATRRFRYGPQIEPEQLISISFDGTGRIRALDNAEGESQALVRLDPLLIGSLFPAHGEDRLIVAPDEIPKLLTDTLIAVEDRRYNEHHGIDLHAIARAAWVNLASGGIRQGASTLTQQLVRSYFLSNEQSWWRKLREACMAVALELGHDKAELMHAYVNEIYLGQDGARAVHGFGLASQFYFGRPLAELELHELALLVAIVRGPTYYDPRVHPERALERRKLVLERMAGDGLVSASDAAAALERPLGVAARNEEPATQSAFLRLVRRQLAADYAREDLEQTGLTVLSTLDPAEQTAAERALREGLDALDDTGAALEGALVVTSPQTGEVRALVGGRHANVDGFNRALDARRSIGSLIKPAVYLAALESGRYTLASSIDDEPIAIELENGDVWAPKNFDDTAHGRVTLVRALAESLNLATVRLGMDVGLEPIGELLVRLGASEKPALYPSLLLGALELTPLETAQIYNTIANGGFRVPVRAVSSVIGEDGEELKRYPLAIEQAVDAAAVYTLNRALVQAMQRGTGRTARAQLPADLTVAGKTGTSDDQRDSWFAGFTSDRLVVAWVGADDNRPTGLTGSTGAARIWARTMRAIGASPYNAPMPKELTDSFVDYQTGTPVAPRCANAVLVPVPAADLPRRVLGCDGERVGLGERLRRRFGGRD